MDHDNCGHHYDGHDGFVTMSVEATFEGTCGFIKLKERHRVKAIMKRIENEERISSSIL